MSALDLQPAWQLPIHWPAQAASDRTARQAAALLKGGLVLAMLAITVFDRFGLRVAADYAIPPGMIALYTLVAILLLTGTGAINVRGALAYLAIACVAGLSFLLNALFAPQAGASLSSYLLVFVLYAPFAVGLHPRAASAELWRWALGLYIAFSVFLAAAGMAQFFAQFFFRPEWLFDYMPLIPEPIRASGSWNTVNWADGWIKSNGFFLREASIFSIAMAFAFICELGMRRRKWVMAMLLAGLVLTYSGSGLLCLAAAMVFPLDRRALPRLIACLALGCVVYLALGGVLHLDYTLERIDEVSSGRTSAYCRFIYPNLLILNNLDASAWAALLGHGPGTMPKLDSACGNGVETTYAKALFEYGLAGALAFGALIVPALNRSAAPMRMRAALAVMWLLLGGNLLTSEFLLLIYVFSAMWPEGFLGTSSGKAAVDP